MKICVFGASGYVGASIYQKLKDLPEANVVGTYLEEPATFDSLEKLDINQPESFSDFYKKQNPDVVIWSVMSGSDEQELTNQGLMHLMTHLTPQTKLVYISSDLVFGEGNGPYAENDPISTLPNDHLYSNYINGKIKAERLIDNELTNYTILRVGPIYGENKIGRLDDDTDHLSTELRLKKSISYRDDLIRTFVHIEDLADVVVEMTQNNVTGIYHIGPLRQQSIYHFMLQTAEQLGYDPSLIRKDNEEEEADQTIPKNTSLKTEKITEIMNQSFR